MANAIVQINAETSLTLTLSLFTTSSDTAVASGKTLTEQTNRKGTYQATVTEGLTGWHLAIAFEGTRPASIGYVLMSDTTATHFVLENSRADVWAWGGTAIPTSDTAGYPKVTIKDGTGVGEINTNSGAVVSVESVTGAVGSVTGNVGGNVNGSVASVTAPVTVGTISANVITASSIATDAIAEIQSGLATSSALTTVDSNVTAILTDTAELQTDWVNGGRLDLILDSRSSQASVDVIDGIVDTILVDTNELQTDWTNGGRLDLILDTTALEATSQTITTQLVSVLSLVEAIAITGAATYVAASSSTLTVGTLSSGTYASTAYSNDVFHVHTDSGGAIDLIYDFEMGVGEVGIEVLFNGRVNGVNDSIVVQAYDWVGLVWDTLWTQVGVSGSVDTDRAEPILAKHTGTGANDGDVRIRFYAASGLTSATLYIDQLLVAKTTTEFNLTAAALVDVRTEMDNNSTKLAAIVADTNELQVDWVNGGRLDLILDARSSQTSVDTVDGIVDAILIDTAEIGAAGAGLTSLASATNLATVATYIDTEVAAIKVVTDAIGTTGTGLTAIPWNASWDTEVQSECTDALNAYDPPTNTEMEARTLVAANYGTASNQTSMISTLGYVVLNTTTIATLASQTSFTLTAGSADDDAYNGCVFVALDQSTAVQKAVGVVLDYTGSTKTVTLTTAPIFTIATGDSVSFLADRSLKSTVENRTLDVATTGEAGLDFDNIKQATGSTTLTNVTVPVVTSVTNGVTLAASAVQAIWDGLTSALTTAGSIGKSLVTLVTDYTTARAVKLDNLDATISSRSTITQAQVNTEVDTALFDVGLTTTITGRIDAAISSRLASASYTASPTAQNIWEYSTRTLTSFSGLSVTDVSVSSFSAAALSQLGPLGLEVDLLSVVSAEGNIEMFIGDDYYTVDGRYLYTSNEEGTWPDLTGATISFIMTGLGNVQTVAGSVFAGTPGAAQEVRAQVPSSITDLMVRGSWKGKWVATLTNGHVVTLGVATLTVRDE